MTSTTSDIEQLLTRWDGLGVVTRRDAATGSWIFIALHDARLGPPTGGTRYRLYDRPADALHDAMRLAAGMTAKWAVVDIPFGGAKAVIAPPGPLEPGARRDLLRRYGALVESLNGAFLTGEDLGTTPDDMAEIAAATRRVLGTDLGGHPTDPGPFTAHGVVRAMEAVVARLDGEPSVAGRTVAVQGVGDVGGPLAREIARKGASLVLSDTDGGRVAALADELGAAVVSPDAVYDTECDVFAPCAIGAVVSPQTVPRLACLAVCGSANNQLASSADARALRSRGILYAPDYVANAGGAIAFAHLHRDPSADAETLFASVASITGVMTEILAESAEREESPLDTARRRVERKLAERGPAPWS